MAEHFIQELAKRPRNDRRYGNNDQGFQEHAAQPHRKCLYLLKCNHKSPTVLLKSCRLVGMPSLNVPESTPNALPAPASHTESKSSYHEGGFVG